MIIWSEGMRIYAVNKAAQAFFGRSSEELTNAKFGYEDDKEDESWDWSPEEEAEQSDNVFRLFDLIHKVNQNASCLAKKERCPYNI